jgi:hypothetical protein
LPEQTQSEDLSDASFLGKLMVLPANVSLDWKEIASYKHSGLLGLIISDEGKKFCKIDTWKRVSPAGSQFLMTVFRRGFPS